MDVAFFRVWGAHADIDSYTCRLCGTCRQRSRGAQKHASRRVACFTRLVNDGRLIYRFRCRCTCSYRNGRVPRTLKKAEALSPFLHWSFETPVYVTTAGGI